MSNVPQNQQNAEDMKLGSISDAVSGAMDGGLDLADSVMPVRQRKLSLKVSEYLHCLSSAAVTPSAILPTASDLLYSLSTEA